MPIVIKAAGGLVWRRSQAGRLELAVIHRPKYDDWSLPKGKLEPGESFLQGALREVREETGVAARPLSFAGASAYAAKGRPKLVLYWHMLAEAAEPFVPNREVDQLLWLTPQDALQKLQHPAERRLVGKPPPAALTAAGAAAGTGS